MARTPGSKDGACERLDVQRQTKVWASFIGMFPFVGETSMALDMRVRPILKSVSVERTCPAGTLSVKGTLAFYSPQGVEIATRSLGTYGDLKMKMTDGLRDAGLAFMEVYMKEVENALNKEADEAQSLGDAPK